MKCCFLVPETPIWLCWVLLRALVLKTGERRVGELSQTDGPRHQVACSEGTVTCRSGANRIGEHLGLLKQYLVPGLVYNIPDSFRVVVKTKADTPSVYTWNETQRLRKWCLTCRIGSLHCKTVPVHTVRWGLCVGTKFYLAGIVHGNEASFNNFPFYEHQSSPCSIGVK